MRPAQYNPDPPGPRAIATEYARLASIVDTVDVALALLDRAGRFIVVNDAWERFSGYRREATLGRRHAEIGGAANVVFAQDQIDQVMRTGERFQAHEVYYSDARHPQGMYIEGSVLPIRAADGSVTGAIIAGLDVTEKVRAREEAQAQQAVLATIFESVPVGIALFDCAMCFLNLNNEYARMSGWDAAAIRGRSLYDLDPTAPDRRLLHGRVLAGETVAVENVSWSPPDDDRPHYYDIRYRPVRDSAGVVSGVVSAVVDVTARHDLDLQKDDFLVRAAHELRTPLTTIKGYAQTSLRAAERLDDVRLVRPLRILGQQTDRLARLIDELLDVSRLSSGELPLYLEPFDLRDLIAQVVADMRLTAPDFAFSLDLPAAPARVAADRQRIEEVLRNLLQNAIKYAGDSRGAALALTLADGQAITAVRDAGIGIPAAQQGRIFQRFFRASNVSSRNYSGLGVGLFISERIIGRHGGRMWLESAEGVGSTFYFTLPLPSTSSAAL